MKRRVRHVLAEGYPWFFGIGPEYHIVQMEERPLKSAHIPMNVPADLLRADVPKYRLVLELVRETGKLPSDQ